MNRPTINHRFVVELFRDEGGTRTVFGQRLVEKIDWVPVVEAACFAELRRQPDTDLAVSHRECVIEPVWSEREGRPHIEGIIAEKAGGGRVGSIDAVTFFADTARDFAEELIKEGKLPQGDLYHYRVAAYPDPEAEPARPMDTEDVEHIAVPPPICAARTLQEAAAGEAVAYDPGSEEGGDFPVYLPRAALDEATALTAEVERVETGGILIGNLHRDEESGDLGMVITAQIPGTGTRQDLSSLTFTGETWAAVDGALKLRGKSESMLGWWHSHPAIHFCPEGCSREQRLVCPRQRSFFSDIDKNLHRAIFPKAWGIGLLITNSDRGMRYSLWGWRQGTVQRRGFTILETSAKTRVAVTI